MYLPILLMIYFSFGPANDLFIGYKELLDLELIGLVFQSILISLIVAILSILLSLSMLLITHKKLNYRLLSYYIIVPDIISALSFFHLIRLFHIQTGFWCLMCAYLIMSTFYSLVIMQNSLHSYETQILEEAACDLGASYFKIFTKITIPSMKSTIISAICVSIIIILDDIVLSIFLSGSKFQTLASFMFSAMKFGKTIKLNALSSIVIFVFVFIFIYYHILRCVKKPT